MTKADIIESWLRSKIGCGYVYGATGWVCTPARIAQQQTQYPDQVNPDVVSKWIGMECYDCAQLVRKSAAQAGYKMLSGATSQWKTTDWADKGTIDSKPSGKLLCLFRDDGKGTKNHVGLELPNGDVIDARGSQYGVVCNLKYTGWTHWALLPGLDEDMEGKTVLYQARVETESGVLNVREGTSTSSMKVGSIPKGAVCDVIYESPEWLGVQYDNISGYCAAKYLAKVDAQTEATEQPRKETYTALMDNAGHRITIVGNWRVVS